MQEKQITHMQTKQFSLFTKFYEVNQLFEFHFSNYVWG